MVRIPRVYTRLHCRLNWLPGKAEHLAELPECLGNERMVGKTTPNRLDYLLFLHVVGETVSRTHPKKAKLI